MKLFPAVMIAGLLASGAAVATELDLSVNADAVKLGAEFDVTNNLRLGGNWLYHQDKGHVLTGDAHVTGNAAPSLQTLRAGLGLLLAYVDSDESTKEDGFGIPLGGFVRYTLPQYDRISFGGSLYYAPGVLSFGDLDPIGQHRYVAIGEQVHLIGDGFQHHLIAGAENYVARALLPSCLLYTSPSPRDHG